ncbi:MAG TPA: Na+/H+ antiporter [Chloroflexia bacterium]|nr:Na+/H+ antiporter [Chloroflexia bacterium]
MNEIEVVLVLLGIMALLLALANKLQVPYPVLLVIGGLAIGFIPGLPQVELSPDLVFLLFLPPLIQSAAFLTPIRDFKANLRPIMLLAVGLVLFTTVVVAVIVHYVIGMSWPVAFVLGAIVAPPDAIAATSIASRLHLPKRIVTLLEGESLVNDASALVAYRVAVVAVTTGVFSFQEAGLQFLIAAAGGVLIGLTISWLSVWFLIHIDEGPVILIFTFLMGFGAYSLAEAVHASGVLAVVALGIYLGRHWDYAIRLPENRLQTELVWSSIVSILNGLVFILIGLQLQSVIKGLADQSELSVLWYVIVLNLTLVISRFVWVFPGTYLPRYFSRKIRERDPYPSWKSVVLIGWTGMRGVVSLAAALALPLTIESGAAFPQRNLIIFLTFTVILFTLVTQGLSLPFMIKWLDISGDDNEAQEEAKARLVAAKAGLARLDQLAVEDWVAQEVVDDIGHHYQTRIQRYSSRYHRSEDNEDEEKALSIERLQHELLSAEAGALIKLRDSGMISDEVLRRVSRELDLERVRLASASTQPGIINSANNHDHEAHTTSTSRAAIEPAESGMRESA